MKQLTLFLLACLTFAGSLLAQQGGTNQQGGSSTGGGITWLTVATLPGSPALNTTDGVTDGNGFSCTVGGGSTKVLCRWNGASWDVVNFLTGKTGQIDTAVNGASDSFQSVGLPDGNGGAAITTTPYVIKCDTATDAGGPTTDRGTTLRFQSGASVITMPDHTAAGCGGNFPVKLINDGAGTLTVNRGGSDTFSIFGAPGGDGATSFPLLNQQTALLNNGSGTIWEAIVTGGSPAITSTTAVTVTNPTINTDTQMMELSLPAGYLNTLKQGFLIRAGGKYNNTVATSPALTFTAKLCTNTNCVGGTTVSLGAIVTGATSATATTNASWGYDIFIITNATGATGNVMSKGDPGLTIELSNVITAPDTVYMDPNIAVSGNIDLTAALFLDFTIAQSVAGASNQYVQLSGMIAPQSNPAGSGGGGATGFKLENVSSTVTTCDAGGACGVTETVVSTFTVPANELGNGQDWRTILRGNYSNTNGPNITFRLRWGGLAGTVLASASYPANAVSTNMGWKAEFDIIANGAPSATTACEIQGFGISNEATSGGVRGWGGAGGNFSNTATVNVPTNASNALVLTVQFTSATAGNTFTVRTRTDERLN